VEHGFGGAGARVVSAAVESSKAAPWWQTGVLYQIYPRSFQDSNGDGIGDLAGITSRLDYLVDLGVDAIWLSPFYPSPMADFGYDVADYCDVDPIFGTIADFDRLVAEAHRRDLRVIVDYVPNHSSDQHPWFKESKSSCTNSKRDFYLWRDPRPDGHLPNNWLSVFGGPAWTWDEGTGQYYLHSFLKEQPDLNWRNPQLRQAMLDVLRFWLDRGVDGFRIDVAHFIGKDPELRDNPPRAPGTPAPYHPLGEYDRLQHLHDLGHPDTHDIFREMRVLLDAYQPPRYSVGEIHVFDWAEWAGYYGADLDELHMPFNFWLIHAPWEASFIREVVDELEGAIPAGAWPNYVMGNHDEPRLATRIGHEQSRVAAMLLLTLRGTPTIYYGEELGMAQVPIPPAEVQDPWGKTRPPGRDGCRTPMPWNSAGGFSRGRPWLRSGDPSINVEVQDSDPTSHLSLYRDLLRLRRSSEALRLGSYRPLEAPPGCFAYLREAGAEKLLVMLNFTDQPVAVQALAGGGGRVLLSTTGPLPPAGQQLELAPHQGLIVELQSTSP